MFDLPVKSLMEPKKLVLLAPETTVAEAAKRMPCFVYWPRGWTRPPRCCAK